MQFLPATIPSGLDRSLSFWLGELLKELNKVYLEIDQLKKEVANGR